MVSSDLIGADVFRHPTVFSLPMLASKYLALGMSLEQILPRMTSVPARFMWLDGKIAALRPGYEADVAVFRMINREVESPSARVPSSLTIVTEIRPLSAGYPVAGSMM